MNNLIPLVTGTEMTAKFKTEKDNVVEQQHKGKRLFPTCETFDREAFDLLMNDPRCEGIRIYSGMDKDLKVRFIIVGVDTNDNDLYLVENPANPTKLSVIEAGIRCPEMCPSPSILNP